MGHQTSSQFVLEHVARHKHEAISMKESNTPANPAATRPCPVSKSLGRLKTMSQRSCTCYSAVNTGPQEPRTAISSTGSRNRSAGKNSTIRSSYSSFCTTCFGCSGTAAGGQRNYAQHRGLLSADMNYASHSGLLNADMNYASHRGLLNADWSASEVHLYVVPATNLLLL